jgi:hypothetical protein
MFPASFLMMSSMLPLSLDNPANSEIVHIAASVNVLTYRDSRGRSIGFKAPSGYRSISCRSVVSSEGVQTSMPTILLLKADAVSGGANSCRLPGIRLREVFDTEMTFSIGLNPIRQFKNNRGYPVSVYQIPGGTSLAPAGYLAAWVLFGVQNTVITYPPSFHNAAMELAKSLVNLSSR